MDTQNVIIAVIAVVALAVVGFFFFQPGGGPDEGVAPASTYQVEGD